MTPTFPSFNQTHRRHCGGAVAGAVARLVACCSDPLQSESLLLKNALMRNGEM